MPITCEPRQTCVECGSGQLILAVRGVEDERKGVCIPGGSDITESSKFIISDEGKTVEIRCVPPSSQSPLAYLEPGAYWRFLENSTAELTAK